MHPNGGCARRTLVSSRAHGRWSLLDMKTHDDDGDDDNDGDDNEHRTLPCSSARKPCSLDLPSSFPSFFSSSPSIALTTHFFSQRVNSLSSPSRDERSALSAEGGEM